MNHIDPETVETLRRMGLLTDVAARRATVARDFDTTVTVADAIDKFEASLSQTLGDATVRSYRQVVDLFHGTLGEDLDLSPIAEVYAEVSREGVETWLSVLRGEGYGYATLRRAKSALGRWFRFVHQQYRLLVPEISEIQIAADEAGRVNALREDEVLAIAEYAASPRNKALVLFLYESGMHRQELIDCQKDDIDMTRHVVNIRNANGKVDRVGTFSTRSEKALVAHLRAWEERVEEVNSARRQRSYERREPYAPIMVSPYLFQTERGAKISYSTVLRALKDAAESYYKAMLVKQGIAATEAASLAKARAEHMDAETLRNSRRAAWFAAGKTVDQVQALMGDANRWACKRFLKVAEVLYTDVFAAGR